MQAISEANLRNNSNFVRQEHNNGLSYFEGLIIVAHASTTLSGYPGFLMPPYADNNGSGDAGNWRGTAPPSILTPQAPSPFVVPSNSKLSTPCR